MHGITIIDIQSKLVLDLKVASEKAENPALISTKKTLCSTTLKIYQMDIHCKYCILLLPFNDCSSPSVWCRLVLYKCN